MADSCIFFMKDEKGKLYLVVSIHVDNLFMAGKSETLKDIKENIKEKFNISSFVKVKTFIGVYCEWVHYEKGAYAKMAMEK